MDSGGAHGALAGKQDVNGGRMDGFIRVTDRRLIGDCRRHPHGAACANLRHPNVMSYHDGSQIAPCSITPMRSSGNRSSTPSKIIVASVCAGGTGMPM